ncbi:MAG: mutL [Bacteroidetes bacterium]|jgi:DNA mismatch repair protein MutL|nr:mutL [Bacteroidota bacterium]
MSDIIHLLPDSIANQIAAGEVIQRPASVVKELVENAIDAGANEVQLIVKDAGRTLIQVIDNGKGMSSTDARMAFERHATSKIKSANDLFSLSTMGFRGEALPSIASVAQVELRTKRHEDELGICLKIAGSKVESQEITACPSGCNFAVRNLFFNVPARRKFLKGNDTEKRNILTELERIALVNPEIEFTFIDNDVEALKFPATNLRQRIVHVMGKSFNQQLIPVEIDTALVKIQGFVGKPESARKTRTQQFFFVNGRYMRHAYFAKAVTNAFEPLIIPGENPNFFLYLEVAPDTIDVNIHPTKTEIKFENEQPIWQIIFAIVKEALGRSNETPSIDFNTTDSVDIPIFDPTREAVQPQVRVNPSYNPFNSPRSGGSSYQSSKPRFDWEHLYNGFEEKPNDDVSSETVFHSSSSISQMPIEDKTEQSRLNIDSGDSAGIHFQYKNSYILTSVKSGLMMIDQHRAHICVLFYRFIDHIRRNNGISQRVLFPEIVEFTASEAAMIPYIVDDLQAIGFELSTLGNNTFSISGVPAEIGQSNPVELIRNIVHKSIDTGSDVKEEIQESVALSIASSSAIAYGQRLSDEEITQLINQLFATPTPNFTPDGRTVISILKDTEISKLFK